MENLGNDFLGIELKQHYFDEFKICGVPIPIYSNTSGFIIQFKSFECYLNYINVLKLILFDLELADPENSKYEIKHSRDFIKNLLKIMHTHFKEKYN
ncbi:MAG: hypothetical protein EOP43_00910 [Sphingobacteriaceae bacterium]|nr:MAG: hypothetical protein EOP43_00910 [Sphingobacteriaceae bacterium]